MNVFGRNEYNKIWEPISVILFVVGGSLLYQYSKENRNGWKSFYSDRCNFSCTPYPEVYIVLIVNQPTNNLDILHISDIKLI
jgi:hypothetical protein